MAKIPVIVESPNKAPGLQKYFGDQYEVVGCYGHVVDLPKDEMGIDFETMKATYVKSDRSKLPALMKQYKNAPVIYYATDPDREGEGIAFHLQTYLKASDPWRLDITDQSKNGIEHALKNKRRINDALAYSQQARREGDRIFGFILSPVLKKSIPAANSFGRVQGCALRILSMNFVSRRDFLPEDRYKVFGNFDVHGDSVSFSLSNTEGTSSYSFEEASSAAEPDKTPSDDIAIDHSKTFISKHNPTKLMDDLRLVPNWFVAESSRERKERLPPAPFSASDMIASAGKLFGWPGITVMKVAQQLFELELITYHRSDSVRVEPHRQNSAIEFIQEKYGDQYAPSTPNNFKSKASAQEAHEAIQPINIKNTAPEGLTSEQSQLYSLIHSKFLISQCIPGVDEVQRIVVNSSCGNYSFHSTESVVISMGWRDLVKTKKGDGTVPMRPAPVIGQSLSLQEVESHSYKTSKPKPFTEGTLIKYLEARGVGRPSSYAEICPTLLKRTYITIGEKQFIDVTPLGLCVDEWSYKNDPNMASVSYTAQLEDKLDAVSSKKLSRIDVLNYVLDGIKAAFGEDAIAVHGKTVWPPTAPMLARLEKLRAEGIDVPEAALTNFEIARDIISKNSLAIPPSEAALSFARSLEKQTGIKIEEQMLSSGKLLSSYIDKAKKAPKQFPESKHGELQKRDGVPTPKMKSAAKKMADALKIKVPSGTLSSFSQCSAFISDCRVKLDRGRDSNHAGDTVDDENVSNAQAIQAQDDLPTPMQIKQAEIVSSDSGKEYTDEMRKSKTLTAEFIFNNSMY